MHPDHEKQGTAGISAERSPGGEMDGQRILAQMHAHCTQYRLLVKDTLHKLKEQEYAAAKVKDPLHGQDRHCFSRKVDCKNVMLALRIRRKSIVGWLLQLPSALC
jgi:hypothetical protein